MGIRRGAVTVTPALELAADDTLTPAKFNQQGQPVAQVAQHQIGEEELVAEEVRTILESFPANALLASTDFVQGFFTDGVGTVASTNFTSVLGTFSAADNGRLIVGSGIPSGTTITYVNGTTITLSQAFTQQFTDGIISGGTTLDSALGGFTNADTGRTITGDGILAGTTITYVSATRVTLSQAATNGSNIKFQISGRPITAVEFLVVGRGAGWRVQVDAAGIGRAEIYVGAVGALFARGKFAVSGDGSVSVGSGSSKLTIDKDGNLTTGSGTNLLGITKDGKLFVGAASFASAIVQFAANGNVTIQAPANTSHNIDTGAVNPAVQPVVASPPGGAITNPTTVVLTCLTAYARIYYRQAVLDGVSTNTSTTYTSATAGFTKRDIGKAIAGTNIPANAYIADVTNATTIVLSAAATASGTALDFQITPNETDLFFAQTPGNNFTLTATRRITARAYKNGEWSTLFSLPFTLDATTVPNPSYSPTPGTYGGTNLNVTLAGTLAGSKIRYNKTFSASGTPADPANPTSASGTLIDNGVAVPSAVVACAAGTTKFRMIAYKSGLSDSQVIAGTFIVSGGGDDWDAIHGGGGGGGEAEP